MTYVIAVAKDWIPKQRMRMSPRPWTFTVLWRMRHKIPGCPVPTSSLLGCVVRRAAWVAVLGLGASTFGKNVDLGFASVPIHCRGEIVARQLAPKVVLGSALGSPMMPPDRHGGERLWRPYLLGALFGTAFVLIAWSMIVVMQGEADPKDDKP